MNILKYRCLRLISFIGFRESSSPFVSAERFLSLRRPYLATRTEWASSPSSILVEPSVTCPSTASSTRDFDGLPYPIAARNERFPSVAVSIQILSCERPRSLSPFFRRESSDGFLLRNVSSIQKGLPSTILY